jgi:cobalt-precorrin-5B (C1)-methyltransferase
LKKGFSLPLWVAGAARSALKKLVGLQFENFELIKIPHEKKEVKIEIHSVGLLKGDSHALGISFAKSGLDLDITENLEIWTIASLEKIYLSNPVQTNSINIIAGAGVGIKENTSDICISAFAKEVLYENLLDIVPEGFNLNLEIIFPNGEFLAERTSNKSFGIVEGLSIIGTSAETYSSASPDQLEEAKTKLAKLIKNDFKGKVVFVIGENGLNLAKMCNVKLPIIKVGNWIGPLIVDAAIKNVKTVILFGYHGKLIKLAGGIFHTHNHLADGRIEILVYLAVKEKVSPEIIFKLAQLNTLEDALLLLEKFNQSIAEKLFLRLSNMIEKRSFQYVNRYVKTDMEIASIIFDRKRKIRWAGAKGNDYISYFQRD